MVHELPKDIQDRVPPLSRAEGAQETIFSGVVLALFFGSRIPR